jgi:hypothetical protein
MHNNTPGTTNIPRINIHHRWSMNTVIECGGTVAVVVPFASTITVPAAGTTWP